MKELFRKAYRILNGQLIRDVTYYINVADTDAFDVDSPNKFGCQIVSIATDLGTVYVTWGCRSSGEGQGISYELIVTHMLNEIVKPGVVLPSVPALDSALWKPFTISPIFSITTPEYDKNPFSILMKCPLHSVMISTGYSAEETGGDPVVGDGDSVLVFSADI